MDENKNININSTDEYIFITYSTITYDIYKGKCIISKEKRISFVN